jgi:hypothetical protein
VQQGTGLLCECRFSTPLFVTFLVCVYTSFQVTRTNHPTTTGGFTWTITFLGDGSDYSLSATPTVNPNSMTVTPAVQADGQFAAVQPCLTAHTLTGLVKGSAYYIRVSAYNSRGFGPATPVNAGAGVVPMSRPGLPSSVTLKVGCA